MKNTNYFKSAIIEESLSNLDVLNNVKISKTDIFPVTERHKTPWVKQWTFHFIEVDESKNHTFLEGGFEKPLKGAE